MFASLRLRLAVIELPICIDFTTISKCIRVELNYTGRSGARVGLGPGRETREADGELCTAQTPPRPREQYEGAIDDRQARTFRRDGTLYSPARSRCADRCSGPATRR